MEAGVQVVRIAVSTLTLTLKLQCHHTILDSTLGRGVEQTARAVNGGAAALLGC